MIRSKIMARRIASVILILFALTGCQSENSSESKTKIEEADVFEEFFRPETKQFEGGIFLPDRQELLYKIVTNDQHFKIEMNIRNSDGCFRLTGWLPIAEINDMKNKRYQQLSQMKVQSKYHSSWEGLNAQFVHLVMDKKIVSTPCPSQTALPEIDKEDYRQIVFKYLFSEFNFNQNQLDMASPELLHGSGQIMFYIKKYDVGVVLDSVSKKLIGISIPKHKLITKYLFTSHRDLLRTDKIEDLSLNPLILSDADEKTNEKAKKYLTNLNRVNEYMKNDSKEKRQQLLNSVWYSFFN